VTSDECNRASEKEKAEIQQLFLTDLFLKQQTAGAEPALQTWENQQCVCGMFGCPRLLFFYRERPAAAEPLPVY